MSSTRDDNDDPSADASGKQPNEWEHLSVKDSKKKSHKSQKVDNGPMIMPDDPFYMKWSGIVLLGPTIPAVFAIITVVGGQIILNSWTGTCGYDLGSFIGAAVAVSYLFLLVYTWVFLGDNIYFKSSILGVNILLLSPYRSLRFILVLYFLVAVAAFIVFIVGTVLLEFAVFCEETAPQLYQFSVFLVASYWLGFCLVWLYIIKFFFGSSIAGMIKETTRAKTVEEVEEKIFRSKFQDYDREKENRITVEDLAPLLESLGVFVPQEEMDALQATLDPEDTGYIEYKDISQWFKKLNAELDVHENADEIDEDEADEKESMAMFSSSKKN